MSRARSLTMISFGVLLLAAAAGCGKKKPPIAVPTPPPVTVPDPSQTRQPDAPRPPAPPVPKEPPPVPMEPIVADEISAKSVEDINKAQVLKPVFFALDSDQVDAAGQAVIVENAATLKKYPGWVITIEGHCDETGTPEYNLALGERRALATKNALVAAGVGADRIKTVSYGKEFPFDPGHDEAAMALNRRAHFVLTDKGK